MGFCLEMDSTEATLSVSEKTTPFLTYMEMYTSLDSSAAFSTVNLEENPGWVVSLGTGARIDIQMLLLASQASCTV